MTHVVLAGAGHAHLVALDALRRRKADLRVTLINDAPMSFYSGMAPGCVAGLYDVKDLTLDPQRVLREQDAFVEARVTGVDRRRRRLLLGDGESLSYDLLSLNVGSRMRDEGASADALPVKPLYPFLESMRRHIARGDVANAVIVGGGAAGVEIAFALNARGIATTLVDADEVLSSDGKSLRRRVLRACEARGVALAEGARVTSMSSSHVVLADGRRLNASLVINASGAAPHRWLSESGLPQTAQGFVAIRETLQLTDDDDVFASGDCASLVQGDAPKAGVTAVRQGEVLARNLVARAEGRRLERWRPQRDALVLLNLCDGSAIGARNGVSCEGRWLWRLKDWIDRRFVARFA